MFSIPFLADMVYREQISVGTTFTSICTIHSRMWECSLCKLRNDNWSLSLIQAADAAPYHAKTTGRDRIVTA
jgi:GGDEF domain-containing protein